MKIFPILVGGDRTMYPTFKDFFLTIGYDRDMKQVLFNEKRTIDIMPILVIIMLIMVMNIFDKNLSTFLFNKTRRGLLSLLYSHPNETYYINQLMQATGSGSGAVQRELKLMLEAGVLVRTHSGNLVYYQANEKCPIFNELKSIVRKTF